jgi:hypothetical protein
MKMKEVSVMKQKAMKVNWEVEWKARMKKKLWIKDKLSKCKFCFKFLLFHFTKQKNLFSPCILIFDSLLGAPRSRVVATLRDYLTCEYKAKYPNETPRVFTKPNLQGNQVKVPQQNNFTDCGLFLLQYVEQFFKDPIKDFRIPVKNLQTWFHNDVVTRKREEIAQLIKSLSPEGIELPEIEFPSKDGKILDQVEDAQEPEQSAFDDDDYVPTEEDLKELNGSNGSKPAEETKRVLVPKKRSLDKNDSSSGESNAKTPKLNVRNKS